MKSRVFLIAVIFSLVPFLKASAEEAKVSGNLTPIGQIVDVQGEKAKFNEYRDFHDGVTGDAAFQYEREKYYLNFNAQDVGRKDQSYELLGGRWGSFRYDFKYDELPHNFTTNAKTFYSGVGGANLTYTPQPPSTFLPNTNFTTWNSFDYSVQRKNYGGGFKLEQFKPLFFGVSVAREERRGVYPMGTAGTSPGGVSIELPTPVNYLTDTIKLEGGYLKDPLSLALGYTYGQFMNDNAQVNFRNPATVNTAATTDTFTLPPDNNYYKFDFKGAVKLPWQSKFNADVSYARNESSRNLFNSYVTDSPATGAGASNIGIQGRTGILLNNYVFNGRLDVQNYNFVFTTNPLYFLDAKVFYKYYSTNNKSTQITTTDSTQAAPPGGVGTTFSNEERLFDYLSYRYGGQIGFKLPMNFYWNNEYSRVHTSRKREDVPTNDDDIINTELRWSGVDFLVARTGYEYLHRHADFKNPEPIDATDIANLEPYIRRFDVATKRQQTVKANLDLFPLEDLSVGLGYKWREIRYTDTILGLQTWRGNEYHVDADYLVAKRVKLFGYFDYEYAKLDQYQRTLPSGTAGVFNPANPPTTTAFNWTIAETDYNWGYGAGTEIFVLPKALTFRLQYSYVKSKGYADYTYLRTFVPADLGRNNDNIDLNSVDNYSLRYFLARATYSPVKSLSFSAGWIWEKYNYDDAQMNGYKYVPTSSAGAPLSYLTGAYANPNYTANVFFVSASYLFF
jgi:MtrB/PioB family decaheme-associated outer membrane protein